MNNIDITSDIYFPGRVGVSLILEQALLTCWYGSKLSLRVISKLALFERQCILSIKAGILPFMTASKHSCITP